MDKDVVHNEIMNDGVRNESSLSKTDKDELELTHNEIPQVNGLYIHGEANGEDTAYTINTDTSVSLLPANIYNDIHEELREVAVKKRKCESPKRSRKASFSLQLGSLWLVKPFMVADIIDDVLLGSDILQGDESDLLF